MLIKFVINQVTKIVFLGACALSSFAVLSEQANAESSLYLQLAKERQVRFTLVANCTGKDHHHSKDLPDDETAIIALDKRDAVNTLMRIRNLEREMSWCDQHQVVTICGINGKPSCANY